MAISANRYANKVYSEHPIALWPLDEEAYYVALADDSDRLFSNYVGTGGTDRVNFCTNPSFETNTTGVSTAGAGTTIARITADGVFGTSCLEVTKGGVANAGVTYTSFVPVIAGQTYTASAYVKIPAGQQGATGLNIHLNWLNSVPAGLGDSPYSTTSVISSSDGWVRVSSTGVAPVNAVNAQIYIQQYVAGTAGQKFLVDGVMVEKSSTLGTFFDGSYGGGAWLSTANNSASVIHAKDRVNLVPNPNFETNVTGWASQNSSALVRSTAQFFNGVASALFTANGGVNAGPYYATRLPVAAGKTYTLSAYVRDINTAQQFLAQIQWWTAPTGGTNISNSTSAATTVTSTGWTRVSITAVAPATATYALVWIATVGTPTNGTQAYVDSYLFEESTIAYPYFDGAQTSISYGGTSYTIAPTWSGTAHASTSILKLWTANDSPTIPDEPSPFDSNIYSAAVKANSLPGVIDLESPELFGVANLDPNQSTFTINTFLYQNPTYINWFKIGFRATVSGAVYEEISDEIPAPSATGWINLNQTFDLPPSFSGGIKVFIQVNFMDSTAGDTASRTVIMNGFSVGQGSELTCYTSLGSTPVDLPAELGFGTVKGISADQYGVLSDNGYYLVKTNAILGQNDAMAMIYGTDNSTRINASGTSLPSFIFPGKGMLHNNGRGNEYTFEMWLKIDPQTSTSKKIVGPLDSDDGVYIKEGFITLAIGDSVGSHYVGQWGRPMLLDIVLKPNNASLLINGEEVVNISYPRSTVDLSSGRDWWGIYSYTTTKYFAVDGLAIYPYVVSNAVAKRRFVYGQGTPDIQSIDAAYQGTPTSIDFATAEYGSSIIYPDAQRWDAGYFNNLTATKDYLSVPNYSLPVINLQGRDVNDWYADNLTVNVSENGGTDGPNWVSFRPNQVTRTNLCTNPSFEVNTTGWSITGTAGTISRDATTSVIGSASGKNTVTGALNGTTPSYFLMGISRVVAGNSYTLSGWTKTSVGKSVGFWINFLDANSVMVGQAYAAINTTENVWARGGSTLIAPAGAIRADIYIGMYSAAAGQTMWIDGVILEESSSILPYFDGSYIDPEIKPIGTQAWTGTAHASSSTVTTWNPDGINYQDQSYFNFPTLNVLNDQIAAVYGVFQADSDIASDRTLFSFSNTINGDTFDITLNSDTVDYSINGTSLYQEVITIGTPFAAGVNLDNAAAEYGYAVSNFFSSPSSIQLYVGGNGTNTFEGKIYNVSLVNDYDYANLTADFYAVGEIGAGFAKAGNYEILLNHISSYSLVPEYEYGKLFLDISVSSLWEEVFPLSYFATYTRDSDGNLIYDLDMLQYNIGYVTVESTGVWTYADLAVEFVAPQDYADLAASVYTTYFGLKNRNTTGSAISTAGSSLQAYATFQSLSSGANKPLADFTYQKPLDPSHIIYVDNENTPLIPTKGYDTKYSIIDDALIFPPISQPFDDYAMVVHLEINQRSIIRNPLRIRKMEITTKGYNENSSVHDQLTHLGTKTGKYIYPYVQQVGYFNNAGGKPFSISKQSAPYLYNHSRGGIGIRNEAVLGTLPLSDTQIFIPINESGADDFSVASLQFMVRPNFDSDTENIKLFQINSNSGKYVFTLNKDGSTTATVSKYIETGNGYVVDGGAPSSGSYVQIADNGVPTDNYFAFIDFGTDVTQTGTITEISYTLSTGSLDYYQNGRYVPRLSLTNDEWYVVGIQFPDGIDFSNAADGGIFLFGGARFNNISYYLAGGLGTQSELSTRVWQNVLDANGVGTTLWSYWDGGTWQDVYVLGQTSSFTITPADLYDAYVGTNGNIIDDGNGLTLQQRGVKLITDASWSLVSGKPA